MALSARRARRPLDIWPGFVDALASLLLVIIFVLLVFALAQFFLGESLSDRDASLRSLQGRMAKLAEVLALERKAKDELTPRSGGCRRNCRATLTLRRSLEEQVQGLTGRAEQAEAASGRGEEAVGERPRRAALLNQQLSAMREQLQQLTAALDASEKKAAEQQVQIQSLGQRLNAALAGKVQELARFRSSFSAGCGRRWATARISASRATASSSPPRCCSSAARPNWSRPAATQIPRVAETLKQVARNIPPDIDWILQIDGHTDRVPIATPQFPSNWELSQARAMSVLRLLAGYRHPGGAAGGRRLRRVQAA